MVINHFGLKEGRVLGNYLIEKLNKYVFGFNYIIKKLKKVVQCPFISEPMVVISVVILFSLIRRENLDSHSPLIPIEKKVEVLSL